MHGTINTKLKVLPAHSAYEPSVNLLL